MDLSKDEKKVLMIWCIIAVIVCLIIFICSLFGISSIKKNNEEAYKKLVNSDNNNLLDVNVYYTAKSSINKYYSFINMNDSSSLLKIYNDEYIEKNEITSNNVLTKVNNNMSFETKAPMCVKNINGSIITLDVFGYEINKSNNKKENDIYYEIVLDYNNDVFELMPINKNEYEGACNEKNS